jgi:hypothetical protein
MVEADSTDALRLLHLLPVDDDMGMGLGLGNLTIWDRIIGVQSITILMTQRPGRRIAASLSPWFPRRADP